MEEIRLMGKMVIIGDLVAKTGLHIGAASTGLEIGGVGNVVVRDPITTQPYIPGSSLKGKMRSLLEKASGRAVNEKRVWTKKPDEKGLGGISMHMCDDSDCFVCNIFGRNNGRQPKVTGGEIVIENTTPTRLIVRDSVLTNIEELEKADTDLPYTEVKWETNIDRITSEANPRQTERVPAGAKFEFEMIYNVFDEQDKTNLKRVFEAINLLEQDYLGGQGSRGYGKVKFENIKIFWNSKSDYEMGNTDIEEKEKNNKEVNKDYKDVTSILKPENFVKIIEQIKLENVPTNE